MATYVPGSETYLPDIKPFTPDYKFLSATLDVREDKYNSNWKATNDVYNKVVFADLSREDTNSQREQYVNNLAPSLEKISGMDLSLAQNVQSAKSVFAPFFEDELIVKDMVKTANYRKEMSHAQRLVGSPDHLVRSMWWQDGVSALQYRMEDFMNMSEEEALAAPYYKYVPQVNLHALSNEILGSLEPPLSMEVDVAAYNSDGSVNPDWIIKQKNGDLVSGTALQTLRKQLQNDPRVIQSYQTKNYVLGRNFAAAGMEAGRYSSVKEGQMAWAQETLSRVAQNVQIQMDTQSTKLSDYLNINVRWDNYKETTGIIPGSDDDKLLNENLSIYERTKMEMEESIGIKQILSTPVEGLESTLQTAYQVLMGINLEADMKAEAEAFSMRDFKSIQRLNPIMTEQRKFKMDMAKISTRNQNAMMRDATKDANARRLAYDLARDKGELIDPTDPLAKAVDGFRQILGKEHTAEIPLNEDGNIDESFDVPAHSAKLFEEEKLVIKKDKVNEILSSLILQNPMGDEIDGVSSHVWTLNIGGKDVTGNMELLRNALTLTDDAGSLVNTLDIDNIHEIQSKIITGTNKETGQRNILTTNPALVSTKNYKDLVKNMEATKEHENTSNQKYKYTLNQYAKAYDLTRKDGRLDKNVAKIMDEGGMTELITPEGDIYTREDYINQQISLAKTGEVTNVNQDWVADWWSGTNDPNYLIQETSQEFDGEAIEEFDVYIDDAGNKSINPEELTGGNVKKSLVVDEGAIAAEAGKVYDALWKPLNKGLTGNTPGIPTGTYATVGLGISNTVGDLTSNPTYVADFDPKVMGGEGRPLAAQFINQINASNAKGRRPIYISGDLEDIDWTDNDSVAQDIISSWLLDVSSVVGNTKTPSSLAGQPRAHIEYSPVYGKLEDGEITTMGYTIKLPQEYLASKVKGGVGDSQYSGLSDDEIKKYSGSDGNGGITILFNKEDDISKHASTQQWSDPLVVDLMTSATQSKTFPKFDSAGNSSGNYTISRISDQKYILNYQYKNYVPSIDGVGGSYSNSDMFTWDIPILPAIPLGEILQNQIHKADSIFDDRGIRNVLAKNRDVGINKQ